MLREWSRTAPCSASSMLHATHTGSIQVLGVGPALQLGLGWGASPRMANSHGTGHIASGIQDQVRDTVLILVAPVPERDLVGTTRTDTDCFALESIRLFYHRKDGGGCPRVRQKMLLTTLTDKLDFQFQLQTPKSSTVTSTTQLPVLLGRANRALYACTLLQLSYRG